MKSITQFSALERLQNIPFTYALRTRQNKTWVFSSANKIFCQTSFSFKNKYAK